jgi:soluble lytic murein transglycosylase-like protein
MRGPVLRIGRDPSNDLVVDGEEAPTVSSRHAEIRQEQDSYHVYDLNSTNGTYVDGKRVDEATLQPHSRIVLGPNGPQFQFELDNIPPSNLRKTQVASKIPAPGQQPSVGNVSILLSPSGTPVDKEQEALLREAVTKARQVRREGIRGQTAMIMREMLGKALHRYSKKSRVTISFLVVALISVTAYAGWTIHNLKSQKNTIDVHINQVESQLQAAGDDPKQVNSLIEELETYQSQARQVQRNLLYRLGVRSEEQDFIESEIRQLMAEFGAEEYSIPPEFVEQVRRFIRQYQGPDREHMERALVRSRRDLEAARRQLEKDNLPPDLAYMVLVESAFIAGDSSSAGAAGIWQFTPATARAYGLKISDGVDERLDARRSTQAAGRYIRELILDFGSGSSVMLALAAYNLGPGKVKRAVRTVKDPIKQRNFWYLYRVRALPAETRQYVPKIIAAIIIGRNPERFGF